MELFFAILIAVILLLFLHFANPIEPPSKPEDIDPNFEELFQYIDASLKGYPDRVHYKDSYGTHTWTCHSRLFTFRIYLKQETLRYEFQIVFSVILPFEFKIQRSLTGQALKVVRSAGKESKRLLAQREIPALMQKLSFYDSLTISKGGVTGIKTLDTLEDLKEWPKTLGASITFLRFLLSFRNRKQPTEKENVVCPYCRNPVRETEKAVSCRQCRTIHHFECWNETDRCSVFGCGNKSELEL